MSKEAEWTNLSKEEKNRLIPLVYKHWLRATPSTISCDELNITPFIYGRCISIAKHREQRAARLTSKLTPEGKKAYKLWRMLNVYQGPNQAFNG